MKQPQSIPKICFVQQPWSHKNCETTRMVYIGVIPPFSFILIVAGQLLSSSHPNLLLMFRTQNRNSNQSFYLSLAVLLVESCQCRDMHLPAALLPNIPVQASDDIAMALLINGRWRLWNDTAGLPRALVLLLLMSISVLSTFKMQCRRVASRILGQGFKNPQVQDCFQQNPWRGLGPHMSNQSPLGCRCWESH